MFARRCLVVAFLCGALLSAPSSAADLAERDAVEKLGSAPGVACLVGFSADDAQNLVRLTAATEKSLYVQTLTDADADAIREVAKGEGLLGSRIFVDSGPLGSVYLADNLADVVIVAPAAAGQVNRDELLRVVRPRGTVYVGAEKLIKPVPEGVDDWTHPYHGPDNNPQSRDQLVRGDLRTQFIGMPKFSPMPEQSVIAGGRIYKAMGHIAHKANQNVMLNTLLCINAYNGAILWKRQLPKGFMIHRNTMIAADDALYLGDHESCKVIDAETGEVRNQFTAPADLSDGPVWKWMAIRDGVLYALVGNSEVSVDTVRSSRRGLGHWPWGMWQGHDYKDPKTAFGFGRTLIAFDLKSKRLLWHYRDKDFLDARGICMNDDSIFCYSPDKFLARIDLASGELRWKADDDELLTAIGPQGRAQHYVTGYATTCYIKCNDRYVFFAGPQRQRLVAVSVEDGKFAWSHRDGNLQLVLRDDGIYAAGPQTTGVRLDYESGEILSELPMRRACTRATGCLDSIFYRTSGGTVRVLTEANRAEHIAPMRPPCQDGVLVAGGHLYWGPWMCGCQLSLYGNIALAPARETQSIAAGTNRLSTFESVIETPLTASENDWTAYRSDNSRSDTTDAPVASEVRQSWNQKVLKSELPTAPIAVGEMVFVADRTGAVHAFGADGCPAWTTYTAGPVYYPPSFSQGRLFVGSADGCVYALDARSGRKIWTFQVAPRRDRIQVFGKLISRWPVAGGVVVDGETVYAAAGITHYDGTYVVALDAATGKLKAENSQSGKLSDQVNGGISMQGELQIVDDELQFLGGGAYETARYELDTLACLNQPRHEPTSQFRTAFYPYYPDYGKYVSIEHTCGDGNVLCHDASYEGSMFGNLALQEPLPPEKEFRKDAAREFLRRGPRNRPQPTKLWEDQRDRRFTAFAISGDKLLAAGHPDENPGEPFLACIDVTTGEDLWLHELESVPVKGGIAVNHGGAIFVSLENGDLVCFEAE